MFRQGDVLITTTNVVRGKKARRQKGRLILAEGEVTGHAHAIADPAAELYVDRTVDRAFLRVLSEAGVELLHEEHTTLTIPPGDYEVRRQREYSPEEIRRVAD